MQEGIKKERKKKEWGSVREGERSTYKTGGLSWGNE